MYSPKLKGYGSMMVMAVTLHYKYWLDLKVMAVWRLLSPYTTNIEGLKVCGRMVIAVTLHYKH